MREVAIDGAGKSVHNALWGAESWEISAYPSDPSVIADGECKGATLREVYPNFPLLFKVIDAKMRLSVQVHPNEETCRVTGGEPKTEMWCALSDGPIYAGLRESTTAVDVEADRENAEACFEVMRMWEDARVRKLITPEQKLMLRDVSKRYRIVPNGEGGYDLRRADEVL